VDLEAKHGRYYPFEFHAADALEFVAEHAHEFDAIHASPPCQRWSHATVAGHAHKHPDLIGPTREALEATGLPYIIENVPRSPLRDPVTLCGTMFGLTAMDDDGTLLHLQRHRWFESNAGITAPRECVHPRDVQWAGSYGGARRDKHEARHVRKGGYVPSREIQAELLGIDWRTTQYALYQSIPPAYTEHLGDQLMARISG
jgi:DNA (cytosine-5)-methyltransferase 1